MKLLTLLIVLSLALAVAYAIPQRLYEQGETPEPPADGKGFTFKSSPDREGPFSTPPPDGMQTIFKISPN